MAEESKDMVSDLIDKVSDKLVGVDSDYSLDLNDVGMQVGGKNVKLSGSVGLRIKRTVKND